VILLCPPKALSVAAQSSAAFQPFPRPVPNPTPKPNPTPTQPHDCALPQEQIWSGADALGVLRLLALLSATQGGVPKRHWEGLRGEFVSAYGHQHLLTLQNLERAGGGVGWGWGWNWGVGC